MKASSWCNLTVSLGSLGNFLRFELVAFNSPFGLAHVGDYIEHYLFQKLKKRIDMASAAGLLRLLHVWAVTVAINASTDEDIVQSRFKLSTKGFE